MADYAASLYVFLRGGPRAYYVGIVSGLTSDYIRVRDKLVDGVVATGNFNEYKRNLLCTGSLFLDDMPPSPPTERSRPLEPSAQVEFIGGKCFVLDIRSVDVPAGAGGVAVSDGVITESKFLHLMRAGLKAYFREEEGGTADSALTPQDYEEAGRRYLLANLEDVFGLRVVETAGVHRLQNEIVASLGDKYFNSEWDFRAPVNCTGAGARNATKSDDFIIFPDSEAYRRPPRPAREKQLTPTKIGSNLSTFSDFMAIFKITTTTTWAKGLVPRLEQRLMVFLDRARAVQAGLEGNDIAAGRAQRTLGILDVVAVIGVVSPTSCQKNITANVTRTETPLLFEMMGASRFVFIRLPYAG